jgi:hypothetical protein
VVAQVDQLAMTPRQALLLDSRRQARKVRAVFWASLLAAAFALWGGWTIAESYGLAPGDGGVLRPLWQRLLFGGFVAALGVAAAGGMTLYISLYALRVEVRGDTIGITTMTPFGRRLREFARSQIGRSAYYQGRMYHRQPSGGRDSLWVNAPWITLRVAGRRFPFIIDLQADQIDRRKLAALAADGVADWREDQG